MELAEKPVRALPSELLAEETLRLPPAGAGGLALVAALAVLLIAGAPRRPAEAAATA